MKKVVLQFGFISGGAMALFLVLTFVVLWGPWLLDNGAIVGYAGMILAFSVIFVGVRSYRDKLGQGSITFGKGLQIGLLITVISSICYAVAWLIVYYNFIPDFYDLYSAHALEKMRHSGASEAAIQALTTEMAKFKTYYANPFINAAISFIEPFPVGVVVSLISAFILRKKPASAA
jgi:hypothetical protein